MRFSIPVMLIALAFAFSACQKGGGQGRVELKTEDDKTFYAVGVMFGSRLQSLKLNDAELIALSQGLRDSAKGDKPVVDIPTYQARVQEMFRERMEKAAQKQKGDGKGFIDTFLKEPGAKKTESGLAYKILKEGNGKTPAATDTVEVHYHGTLTDGTVFDSSVERGKTITFALNRVIKGWTEGVQLLKEGGKIKLVIPPELGYGARGAGGVIPPNATLIFDVELLSIS